MLQAGQHFDFPEDLNQCKIISLVFKMSLYLWTSFTDKTYFHAVLLRDSFDENFFHSVVLAVQFVRNLQGGAAS